MDVFPFRLPSRWIAAVSVSGAQVRSLHLQAVPMVFNPILCTAFNYALFLFKPSWLNPRINAINSACVEVEQLAVWCCPGGFCICGFNHIFLFSKGLCVYPPLTTQPPGLCREECGMWGWLPLPYCAFEDSFLSHLGQKRWLESFDVKYKIRLQPYHLILFPLNAKLWISLEAEWVFRASLQESKNPNSRGHWTEKKPRKREVNAEITEEKEVESPSALFLGSWPLWS